MILLITKSPRDSIIEAFNSEIDKLYRESEILLIEETFNPVKMILSIFKAIINFIKKTIVTAKNTIIKFRDKYNNNSLVRKAVDKTILKIEDIGKSTIEKEKGLLNKVNKESTEKFVHKIADKMRYVQGEFGDDIKVCVDTVTKVNSTINDNVTKVDSTVKAVNDIKSNLSPRKKKKNK